MGIRLKVDGKVIPSQEEIEKAKNEYLADKDIPLPKPGNQKLYERDNEPIQMTEDMTKRLWHLINENTELKQQLYFAEHRLEQIKRLLEE